MTGLAAVKDEDPHVAPTLTITVPSPCSHQSDLNKRPSGCSSTTCWRCTRLSSCLYCRRSLADPLHALPNRKGLRHQDYDKLCRFERSITPYSSSPHPSGTTSSSLLPPHIRIDLCGREILAVYWSGRGVDYSVVRCLDVTGGFSVSPPKTIHEKEDEKGTLSTRDEGVSNRLESALPGPRYAHRECGHCGNRFIRKVSGKTTADSWKPIVVKVLNQPNEQATSLRSSQSNLGVIEAVETLRKGPSGMAAKWDALDSCEYTKPSKTSDATYLVLTFKHRVSTPRPAFVPLVTLPSSPYSGGAQLLYHDLIPMLKPRRLDTCILCAALDPPTPADPAISQPSPGSPLALPLPLQGANVSLDLFKRLKAQFHVPAAQADCAAAPKRHPPLAHPPLFASDSPSHPRCSPNTLVPSPRNQRKMTPLKPLFAFPMYVVPSLVEQPLNTKFKRPGGPLGSHHDCRWCCLAKERGEDIGKALQKALVVFWREGVYRGGRLDMLKPRNDGSCSCRTSTPPTPPSSNIPSTSPRLCPPSCSPRHPFSFCFVLLMAASPFCSEIASWNNVWGLRSQSQAHLHPLDGKLHRIRMFTWIWCGCQVLQRGGSRGAYQEENFSETKGSRGCRGCVVEIVALVHWETGVPYSGEERVSKGRVEAVREGAGSGALTTRRPRASMA
ncbi:hypothetical protein NMY22_g9657 [Coprinellus aureogranulatus]|nr:hypothetical protein NMY22_g9657 [Coprinellus aureogranulatus]